MGIFDSFSKGFNEGRERARNESFRRNDLPTFPVKLIEPSAGLTVELQVTETDDDLAKMYMRQLKAYARAIEKNGVKWIVNGKTIRLTFSNVNLAKEVRNNWKGNI